MCLKLINSHFHADNINYWFKQTFVIYLYFSNYVFFYFKGHCRFEKLTISKSRYNGQVDVSEGNSLSWSTPSSSSSSSSSSFSGNDENDVKIQSMLDQLKKHR